jgi:hypothetical protein
MRYDWIASSRFVAAMIFLSLTLVIFGNALFMQPEPHPAPLFFTRTSALSDREAKQVPLPVARRDRVASVAAHPKVRPVISEPLVSQPVRNADPIVLAIQQALADAAYGPVTADGISGRQTTDAIRRFQLDQGMAVTGEINDDLISRLISVGAMAQN